MERASVLLERDARPDPAAAVLAALAAGAPVEGETCLVTAHPDDETLGLGASLPGFRRLSMVQVTDGAPEGLDDARRAGFADAAGYRRARAAERDGALGALGVKARPQELGLVDGTAAFHLPAVTLALKDRLAGAAVVLAHAYEGGHPDHDAVAFAVQCACRLLRREGARPPLRLEFAGYHLARGERRTGAFWPDPACPAVDIRVAGERLARKRAALACFRSQAAVVAWFDPATEACRPAPDYDFTRPPPPGAALYDGWGWPLTGALWRRQARAALAELGLGARP